MPSSRSAKQRTPTSAGPAECTFGLAIRVGGVAHAIAWLPQRDALPPGDRPGFEDAFGMILRLAITVGNATSGEASPWIRP